MEKMNVVIITGMSGAGKTNAADWFEDQGYYCVDNMPPALIKNFIELTVFSNKQIKKAAFVVDVRGGEFFTDLSQCLDDLEKSDAIDCKVLFIEASDETLIKRYNETRRNHPLSAGSTTREVIEKEREKLAELRQRADFIIDTTNMKVAGFKLEMEKLFVGMEMESSFAVNITSFGYKHPAYRWRLIWCSICALSPIRIMFRSEEADGEQQEGVSVRDAAGDLAEVYLAAARADQHYCSLLCQRREIPSEHRLWLYRGPASFSCHGQRDGGDFREDGYRVTLGHRDL